MPQFDLYENPNPETCDWAPYLVDLQHEMLSGLATRVMAPLVVTSPSVQPTISRLNPIVLVRGQSLFMSTAEMASIPVRELPVPSGSLSHYRDELMVAVDLIFTAV